jgi:glucuronate isomerase
LFLAKECTKRGWAMQIRFSALRSVNSTLAEKLGIEAGCDGMGDYNCAAVLAAFLNDLDRRSTLPRMIIYSLNPGDQPVIGSILGAFQESVENQEGGGIRGRLQQGTACWFNDAKRGLERQLITVSSLSLLGEDIGMLADARTPFSLSRHEYYRRILCNFIGNMVENGEYLADSGRLGLMVRDICYGNALRYFGFRA